MCFGPDEDHHQIKRNFRNLLFIYMVMTSTQQINKICILDFLVNTRFPCVGRTRQHDMWTGMGTLIEWTGMGGNWLSGQLRVKTVTLYVSYIWMFHISLNEFYWLQSNYQKCLIEIVPNSTRLFCFRPDRPRSVRNSSGKKPNQIICMVYIFLTELIKRFIW